VVPNVRRGRRWVCAVGVALLMVVASAGVAWGHGEEVEVVVEGLAHGGGDLGAVDYGIALTFEDGDPVTDATVTIAATPEEGVASDPVIETVPGVYIGRLVLPKVGTWRVTVSFDHPDASGSVEFTQAVREPAPGAPVVLVDTLHPERIGTVAFEQTSILGPGAAPPAVGEHSGEVIVEAFIADAGDPLSVQYAATVTSNGAPVAGAVLTLSGRSAGGDAVGPTPLSDDGGVHRVSVAYPAGGVWTLTLELALPSGTEELQFAENLPWPHYTTEAGHPKVKYDNEHPERIGTIATDRESIYLGGGEKPTPPSTTAPDVTPTTSVTAGEVVLDLPNAGDELRRDIGLRAIHLAAIALWAVPLFAAALGRSGRFTVPTALIGMGLTVATGLLLTLYGAPLTYPGIFRWGALQERLYGPSYSAAFIVKMVAVALASVGTIVWAVRSRRTTAWVTLGVMGVALVAVTAMSQFHLFSHL
jgi:hypothetical protein